MSHEGLYPQRPTQVWRLKLEQICWKRCSIKTAMSTKPGSAESVISRLTIRGKLCPHNPKLATTASAGTPSCVGFFFQIPNTILLLKTSCLCKVCYDNAVPNGYSVFSPASGNPASPRSSDLKNGIEWWTFRTVGLDIYGIPESIRMLLNVSTDDHQALQLFSNQGQPFYMPLFHTLGRFVPKSLTERDKAIASQYGHPHCDFKNLATTPAAIGEKVKTAQIEVVGSLRSSTGPRKRDTIHKTIANSHVEKEDNISHAPQHGSHGLPESTSVQLNGQRRMEPLVQITQRDLNSQPGFYKTTNPETGILENNSILISGQLTTMFANRNPQTTHQTSSRSAAIASTSFQVSVQSLIRNNQNTISTPAISSSDLKYMTGNRGSDSTSYSSHGKVSAHQTSTNQFKSSATTPQMQPTGPNFAGPNRSNTAQLRQSFASNGKSQYLHSFQDDRAMSIPGKSTNTSANGLPIDHHTNGRALPNTRLGSTSAPTNFPGQQLNNSKFRSATYITSTAGSNARSGRKPPYVPTKTPRQDGLFQLNDLRPSNQFTAAMPNTKSTRVEPVASRSNGQMASLSFRGPQNQVHVSPGRFSTSVRTSPMHAGSLVHKQNGLPSGQNHRERPDVGMHHRENTAHREEKLHEPGLNSKPNNESQDPKKERTESGNEAHSREVEAQKGDQDHDTRFNTHDKNNDQGESQTIAALGLEGALAGFLLADVLDDDLENESKEALNEDIDDVINQTDPLDEEKDDPEDNTLDFDSLSDDAQSENGDDIDQLFGPQDDLLADLQDENVDEDSALVFDDIENDIDIPSENGDETEAGNFDDLLQADNENAFSESNGNDDPTRESQDSPDEESGLSQSMLDQHLQSLDNGGADGLPFEDGLLTGIENEEEISTNFFDHSEGLDAEQQDHHGIFDVKDDTEHQNGLPEFDEADTIDDVNYYDDSDTAHRVFDDVPGEGGEAQDNPDSFADPDSIQNDYAGFDHEDESLEDEMSFNPDQEALENNENAFEDEIGQNAHPDLDSSASGNDGYHDIADETRTNPDLNGALDTEHESNDDAYGMEDDSHSQVPDDNYGMDGLDDSNDGAETDNYNDPTEDHFDDTNTTPTYAEDSNPDDQYLEPMPNGFDEDSMVDNQLIDNDTYGDLADDSYEQSNSYDYLGTEDDFGADLGGNGDMNDEYNISGIDFLDDGGQNDDFESGDYTTDMDFGDIGTADMADDMIYGGGVDMYDDSYTA